jgi:hypothetical protein
MFTSVAVIIRTHDWRNGCVRHPTGVARAQWLMHEHASHHLGVSLVSHDASVPTKRTLDRSVRGRPTH